MRSGGTTGGTHQCHNLAFLYRLAFLDQQRGTMAVAGGITVTMVDFNHVAITETAIRPGNNPTGHGHNLGSFLSGYINAFVQFPAAIEGIITIAVIGRHPTLDNRATSGMYFLM